MRYLQGGSSLADEPAESPTEDATVDVDPNQEGHPASEMPSAEKQRLASPGAPIDSEDIDVSDWEVAGPDV